MGHAYPQLSGRKEMSISRVEVNRYLLEFIILSGGSCDWSARLAPCQWEREIEQGEHSARGKKNSLSKALNPLGRSKLRK
jgi:hypothetical protein